MAVAKGGQNLRLLEAAGITAAATAYSSVLNIGPDAALLTMQFKFVYGSGGTSATAYLQTSLDNGVTWIDIACAAFTTASATKAFTVSGAGALTAATVPTDGALAADTTLDGMIGDQVRVKYVSVGTYGGLTTLAVLGVVKTNLGGPSGVTTATTTAGSLAKAEEAVHASGDTGVMALAVRRDAAASSSATSGMYSTLNVDAQGRLYAAVAKATTLSDNNNNNLGAGVSDETTSARILGVYPHLFNNSGWDRPRGNFDTAALITAAAATTTQTSADQTNYNGRGVTVVLDMTNVGTGSVNLTIQGKDVASGKYYTLLAGAAVVTNVTNVYTVYPAVTAAANVSANSPLPRTWRVVVTANNANPTTFTVGASVLV
jgi:hypothetical protein